MKKLIILILFPCFVSAQINQIPVARQEYKEPVRLKENVNHHGLYVCFKSHVHFTDSNYLKAILEQVYGVDSIINEYHPTFERGILISNERLDEMERDALRISGRTENVRRLRNIVHVKIENPTNERLLELGNRFHALPDVESCDLMPLDPIAPPGDILPPTPNYEPAQGYLGPNPGVNMTYAWGKGLHGEGIRIRDIEYGFNPNHEELMDQNVSYGLMVNSQAPASYVDHGTAVFGILYANKGTYGVSGMTYGASEVKLFSEWPQSGYNRILGISTALNNSQVGDVVLYEMQTRGQGEKYVPAEFDLSVWNLTKAATDAGIIIVAAAGNGGENLDAAYYSSYMNRGNSGAIIVGAGSTNILHTRLSFSTYGSRVDVQAWGENVITSGYGNYTKIGNDPNQSYTNFSGTSSATPIVASCVSVLQSYYHSITGNYMSPDKIRNLLIRTGIPQGSGGHIGPLPNMQAAIDSITLTPPVADFVADNLTPCTSTSVSFNNQSVLNATSYEWSFNPPTVTFLNGTTVSSKNPYVLFDSSGTYTVRLKIENPGGIDSIIKSDYIKVYNSTLVAFDSIPNQCLQSGAFTLTEGSPPGGIYSGKGVRDGKFDPSLAGVGIAELIYAYTDSNGCIGSAYRSVAVVNCTSVKEINKANIACYPNPTQGLFTINAGSHSINEVMIYDYCGRLVEKKKLNHINITDIDISNLTNGIYTLQLVSDDTIKTILVVLNK